MNIRFFLILILLVATLILGFFSWNTYGYYQAIHADDPIKPNIRVELGNTKIIRGDIAIDLIENESYILKEEDIVETGEQSKGVITWPDRSVTRLGENTRILIQKIEVDTSYQNIEISYDLIRGKVWNTIIRLLIGESYFEVHLPKENIVAGVRGTTFEINLENGYIHAVEHSMRLTDTYGKVLDLFPGELVSSENIWVKKGAEWIDTSWQEWNHTYDESYKKIRSLDLQNRIGILSGGSGALSEIRKLSGNILSQFEGFEAIKITQYLNAENKEKLSEYSEAVLLEYYQKITNISLSEDRDFLRETLLEKIKNKSDYESLSLLLQNMSIWESIDSGKILPSTERILREQTTTLKESIEVLKNIPESQRIFQSLSGSLRGIMRGVRDTAPAIGEQ